MASEQHNYAVYDETNDNKFVISKNSASYGYTSYLTAYLKANYPDEFMCCYLNVENRKKQQDSHEKVALLEKDLSNFNIELLPRDINTCNVDYEIVKKRDISAGILKTQIRPAILCKGLGVEVAEDVVKHRPYTDLRSLAHQTTQGIFTKESLGYLIDIGFFDNELKEINKAKNRKDKINLEKFKELVTNKFDNLRKDKQKSAAKGIGSEGLFD
jgi:DNA polymerase III alpha subunit